MTKYKKVLIIILAVLMVLASSPSVVMAVPTPPAPPEAPTAPEAPDAPAPPEAPPEAPTAPEAPDAPQSPKDQDSQSNEGGDHVGDETSTNKDNSGEGSDNEVEENSQNSTDSNSDESSTNSEDSKQGQASETNQSGSSNSNGQTGEDTTIETGNATNDATGVTTGNTNKSVSGSGGSTGATIVNNDNGANSKNNGSATVKNDNTTIQDNQADVSNTLNQSTVTGDNSASRNTGGDNTIDTGDANTTGTLITAVNTNIDGVAVSEFNVVDDHVGDIVLDFDANCITNCGTGNGEVINTGNGDSSENGANLSDVTNNNTFQNNDATVENSMTLEANSGDNHTDRNTNGDNTIATGDANVSANVLTFANNNIAGNILYGVVNIFGNLIGDIILPEGALSTCCVGDAYVANTGNGTGSENDANVNIASTDETYQFNNVDIENNLLVDAATGDNDTSRNTSGTNNIETGDASVVAQVLNIANTNISGGDWWLVIINEAGKWYGKIIGAPGSNYVGSEGFLFALDESGTVTATNEGNGADSDNTTSVNQETNTTTVQTNDAKLVNNVDLTANTGGNSASRNTGGNNSITTGDANVIANIANFVNNNIVGDGSLIVTVVNVFGSWIGDFIGPGHSKSESTADTHGQNDGGNTSAVGGHNFSGDHESSGGSSSDSGDAEDGGRITSQIGYLASTENVSGIRLGRTVGEVAGSSVQGEGEEEMAMVGSADSVSTELTSEDDSINVNLAWLIFLFPAYLVVAIARKTNLLALIRKSN